MSEELETEKWKIFFKQSTNKPLDESYIEIIFRLKSDIQSIRGIKKEDLEELKFDLGDLGKWRKYKELKRDLEQNGD